MQTLDDLVKDLSTNPRKGVVDFGYGKDKQGKVTSVKIFLINHHVDVFLICEGYIYDILTFTDVNIFSQLNPIQNINELFTDIQINLPTAKTSYAPDFTQIPYSAMVRAARRFELGTKKYGKDNWRKGLTNREYILERINHIINHCMIIAEKIDGKREFDKDDDVGGILWGGCFLSEALRVNKWDSEIDMEHDA